MTFTTVQICILVYRRINSFDSEVKETESLRHTAGCPAYLAGHSHLCYLLARLWQGACQH